MKKITFEFSVGTRYIGSTVKDEVELEFDDDATDKEIEEAAEDAWVDWRNEQCEGGFRIISEQIIDDED